MPQLASRLLMLAAGVVGLASSEAMATNQAGRVSAKIGQMISLTEDSPMTFAAVAPPPTGGTIVLSPAGTIGPAAGFVFRGTAAAGVFSAHGFPHHPMSVSFSTGNLVTGPGPAMRLGAFTDNAPATFDGAASLNFAVGASLVVNPHQTPGRYSGTYAVTVNF